MKYLIVSAQNPLLCCRKKWLSQDQKSECLSEATNLSGTNLDDRGPGGGGAARMPLISFFDFPAMAIFFGEPQANTRGAFSFGSFSLGKQRK